MNNYIFYKKSLIFDGAPHFEKQLNKKELKDLLKKNNAYFIRNVYNYDCPYETSFWYIVKDSFNGFEELGSTTRNNIRRAQKLLDIQIIDKQLILEQAYEVYLSSFQNYVNITEPPVSEDIFKKGLKVDIPGEQFWGCIDKENGKLIAYARNIITDHMCSYSSMKANPEYLKGYFPFYGLFYAMNEYYLKNMGLRYVSDGARSITNHSNIQPFLIDKFKFRKAYCMLSITYVWWLNIPIVLLFPFRKYFKNSKIQALFRMEEMARNIL